jgi:hypothetical protein
LRREQCDEGPGGRAAGQPAEHQTGQHDDGARDCGPQTEGDVLELEEAERTGCAQVDRQQGSARSGEGLLRGAQPTPRRPGGGGAQQGGDGEHDAGLEDQAEAGPRDRDEGDRRGDDQQRTEAEEHLLRAQSPPRRGRGPGLEPRGRRSRGELRPWTGGRRRNPGWKRGGLRGRDRQRSRRADGRRAGGRGTQGLEQGVAVPGQVGQRRADPGDDERRLRGGGQAAGGTRPGADVVHRPAAHRARERPATLLRRHVHILARRSPARGGSG